MHVSSSPGNHRQYIGEVTTRDDVLGLLITGSIAHGFETEISDVDVMILVSPEDFEARLLSGAVTYHETESCTYKGGYIDGKYTSIDFLRKVADHGSEPARFAFEGAKVAFCKIDGVQELLGEICRYPVEKKLDNIKRFYAQFEASVWYYFESVKHNNAHLLHYSITNMVLFGGRLILAHNELLYPYHKWFLRMLGRASAKPDNLAELIHNVYEHKDEQSVRALYETIKNFTNWGVVAWPAQFMMDSELSWMHDRQPIADM